MGKDERPSFVDQPGSGAAPVQRRAGRVLSAFAALIVLVALGLFAAAGWFATRGAAPSRQPRPLNLLLVTIDTLRADRVGRGLTPTIDRLASRGVAFTSARTVAPLTLPAHVSLMTGLLPPQHGVRGNGTYRFDGRHSTIASVLHAAGFQTAAFIGAYVLDRRFGLADGFDTYDDRIDRDPRAVARLEAERPANIVADSAIAWLQKARSDRPVFMWVHFYDAHAPYAPPPEYLARAKGQAYDGEVAFADAELSRLLDAVAATGRAPNTVVAVVGDHGESLGEHGEPTHGMLVFEPALRVPLVLAGPGVPVRRMEDAVSIVDLPQTLLRLVGSRASGIAGGDLLGAKRAPADLYSETEYPKVNGWSPAYTLLERRWKLILSPSARLFDLLADPAEQHNVATSHSAVVSALTGRINRLRTAAAVADATQRVSTDVAARLRALGYVASSAATDAAANSVDASVVIDAWRDFDQAETAVLAHDYARALSLLARLVASHPESPTFASGYVTALQQSGNARRAMEVARVAVARHPNDATLFHALAVAAREAGASAEALRAEQAAAALSPDDPGVHNGLGLLAVDSRRPADATAAFERATTLDPNNAEYWTNLGNARRENNDNRGAEQAYRRALAVDSSAADAANGLGVLMVQTGQPREAIGWFERALARDRDFFEARLNLGIAYQECGDAVRAARMYREVLRAPARFARERQGASRLLEAMTSGKDR